MTELSPEKHLAAILAAWQGCDGRTVTDELLDALSAAEKDFDGVEGGEEVVSFADLRVQSRGYSHRKRLTVFDGRPVKNVPTVLERLKDLLTAERALGPDLWNRNKVIHLEGAIMVETLREEVKRAAWELPEELPLWAGA